MLAMRARQEVLRRRARACAQQAEASSYAPCLATSNDFFAETSGNSDGALSKKIKTGTATTPDTHAVRRAAALVHLTYMLGTDTNQKGGCADGVESGPLSRQAAA